MSDSSSMAMHEYKSRLERTPPVDFSKRYDKSTREEFAQNAESANNRGMCRVKLVSGKWVVLKGIEDRDFRSVYEPYVLQIILGPHKHVVRLGAVFYIAARHEIMLEFESCTQSLLDYTLNHKMTPAKIRATTMQLLAGVRYMHEKLVLHCDIKPANILLKENEDDSILVKLGDFGVSCLLPTSQHDPPLTFDVNPTGHKPPEILLTLPWKFPVDVFSLGCTLATICNPRRHPFLFRNDWPVQTHLDHILAGFSVDVPPDYGLLPPEMTYARDVARFGSIDEYVRFYPRPSRGERGVKVDVFAYIIEETGDETLHDLILKMLVPDPARRITAAAASFWVGKM